MNDWSVIGTAELAELRAENAELQEQVELLQEDLRTYNRIEAGLAISPAKMRALKTLAGEINNIGDIAKFAVDYIAALEIEGGRLQAQVASLQSRVHLCAGYDALEAENARLRAEVAQLNFGTRSAPAWQAPWP